MNLDLLITISSWITVVITTSLSIPQLIKLIRDKKTGNVNFISFWIFHLGIMLWLVYGAFSTKENPYMLLNVIIADGISIFINGVMMYLLYHYKKEINLTKKLIAGGFIILTWLVSIALILIWSLSSTIRITSQQALVFSLIAPSLTTFAFVPQLIQSIKTKNWKGVSHWMIFLFTINNIVWIVFWVGNIIKVSNAGNPIYDLIGALIWQSISLAIYSYQYVATLYYNNLDKKKLQKEEEMA
ncbi:PQ-loop domain-containing transporter [Mycoplasma crocodyli]|uniref:Putative membrane protein n=1 Tax=Mycoplasma crocodyli (strain ATCC 51981 / MP145) TaxID=512564 RepID=D5E4J6_MYCCM|nr:PQ-loop domain-containing transporter [Mycoplasma crocodyli]ADE19730.1 putative membrane protein [Mycoplasma crocodyli MP145]